MRTIVKGKNFDVPDEDRRYVERKMRRFERFLDDRTDALVELSVEQHRSAAESRIVDVTMVVDGRPLRGVARSSTHHAAIDLVADRLERQAVGLREKPRHRARPIEEKQLLRALADGTADPGRDGRPRVVKVKRFGIEPMFEEDAVARMEELGHSFFIFVNAESERVAVLYRRNDGDYGVIEPQMGGEYTTSGDAARRRRSARRGGT